MHIVFLCECTMCLCLVLHLLYRFTGSFDQTPPASLHWDFLILCALYPGLSLQIPWPSAETAARTMWFYSETHTSGPPHIRATPGQLHNHLQMHPQTRLQNEQSSLVSLMFWIWEYYSARRSSKYLCWPCRIPLQLPKSVSLCLYLCANDISLTHWHSEHKPNRRHDAAGVFHMCGKVEFNTWLLTSYIYLYFYILACFFLNIFINTHL